MIKLELIKHLNNIILRDASKLLFVPKELAPSDLGNVLSQGRELSIWTGASNDTIFGDSGVNWAFRALHDSMHRETGLGFDVDSEIELGRIQASFYSGLVADIVYAETAGQASYFKKHGVYVPNQVTFTTSFLKVG